MLEDLDETIRQLLVAEMPIKNGDVDIKFHQPKREWSSRLTRPTINLFMYDLRENVALRRHQWENIGHNGNGSAAQHVARMKRTPFRLDCHYMLTVWATEPEDEHQLLSSAMLALFRCPTLTKERLVGSLQNQPYEIQARLAAHDKLTNPAEVWGALDNEIRPSISYIVTVAFDPWTEQEIPLTTTFTVRTGQSSRPEIERLNDDGLSSQMSYIRGFVTAGDKEPQAGLRVSLKGTTYATYTDETGRFVFGGLPDGAYTLMAWPEKGQAVEKEVSVPVQTGNYDIELA